MTENEQIQESCAEIVNPKFQQSLLQDGKAFRESQYKRAVISVGAFISIAWALGRYGYNIYWLLALVGFLLLWWKCKISWLLERVCKDADTEARRERAFSNSETVEWLNLIINRWIVFSDESLLLLIKNSLDPLLESCLPPFIGAIEVSDFTLGTRTPYIQHVTAYDSFDDLQKIRATAFSMRQPPADLMTRPKYRVVLDLDIGLASPDARFVIRIRLGNKGLLGAETDIAVEDFQISGRMQLVLQFNRNIAFPHLASLSFCFLEEPQVTFDIRMLKAVQVMDVPLVRQWVSQMVNDTLKMSLVDPDRIYIPLCDDPEELARGEEFACGVLTVTINGGTQGRPTDDPYWCVVSLGEQKINTKDVTSDNPWTDYVSLLVYNLHYDRLTIKIKGKRKIGTKYTVTQYDMPLARLYLDTSPSQEKVFEKESPKGANLNVQMEYTALPLACIPNDDKLKTDEEREESEKSIPEKIMPDSEEVSGVVLVTVHCGESLIPMDKNGLSDPYCMMYANRNLIHKTHVIKESLDPVWNSVTEFTVTNINQMTLSFVVLDKDDGLRVKDTNDDFLGSCNFKLSQETPVILRKELHLLYKLKSSVVKSSGKLCVSIVFRPIASVRKSWKPELPGGFPEGEPIDQFQKDDTRLMEALLMAERGAVTVIVHRGRHLVAMDITGKSDPFVTLRTDDNVEKFRSKVVQKTLNPVWNETVTIAMPGDGEHLNLDVWDKDALSQEKMGSAVFKSSTLKDLTKDPQMKHWIKLSNTKSGEIQLSFKFISPEECSQAGINNNLLEEGPESVSPEDLHQDQQQQEKSGWKKVFVKRRVFGVTGPKKKSTPNVTVQQRRPLNQLTEQEEKNSDHQILQPSPTSSYENPFSSDDESTHNMKTQLEQFQKVPQTVEANSRKNKPKLLSVVNSVKSLKCNSPSGLSDTEDFSSYNLTGENDFEDVDGLLDKTKTRQAMPRQSKIKGVRKRLSSWRSKKERSVSENDMAGALQEECEEDKDLMDAWFDGSPNAKDRKRVKINKVHSLSSNSERKNSSPHHLPIRGYSVSSSVPPRKKNF